MDTIVLDGLIVDGAGNPWYRADIGIQDGRIARIGRLKEERADRKIQASGLVVAPGFIDMHSHSDLSLFISGLAESKTRQGVTTEVIGQDGFSAAPVNSRNSAELRSILVGLLASEAQIELDWTGISSFLDRLEKAGTSVNVPTLVGHSTVRMAVMDFDSRRPTDSEFKEMKRLVSVAMDEGAFGLSSGIQYPPGSYAETAELIELCKVVAAHGGIYVTHMRDESDSLIDSVGEAIEIGIKSGAPVNISHHKAQGQSNWGKVKKTLSMIDEARNHGLDITCDQYQYTAGASMLTALLPTWAVEGGGEKMVARLKDPSLRKKLIADTENGIEVRSAGWDKIMIAHCKSDHSIEGKYVSELAKAKNCPPTDIIFDLLIREGAGVGYVIFFVSEEDICEILRHPTTMIGSDGAAVAPYGDLGRGKPHPRFYGNFARVLGRYSREQHVLSLEEAVRKMTSLSAQRLGLHDRGLIKPGMKADIVIFDKEQIIDEATYTDPHQYASGVEYVFVNGTLTVEKGNHTGEKAGEVLRYVSSYR